MSGKNIIDSRKMSPGTLDALLASIESKPAPNDAKRRRHERVPFLNEGLVICRILANESEFAVKCRNISAGGIGFLHKSFIHPATRCEITLISRGRRGFRVPGKVVRCRHVAANLHEVGVQFNELFDLELLRDPGEAGGTAAAESPR